MVKYQNAKFNLQNSIETFLFDQNPKFVTFKDTDIITSIKPNQNNINIKGKYSFNNENFLDFNTDNLIKKEMSKFQNKCRHRRKYKNRFNKLSKT